MSVLSPSSDIGIFGRRQRHVRGHRIPVEIVAGSGPMPDANTTVIEDTLGCDEMLSPFGSCRCCTIREKLQQAVRKLAHARPGGGIAIRTDADIMPILRTFVLERALGGDFYVEQAPPLAGDRFTLAETAPLRWDAFSRFIATLTGLRGADLLHAGGLVNVQGCRGPVAVQLMGHLAARPVELRAWPDEARASSLEFVTRGIDEKTMRELFRAVCALS
jgi:G3E family GTPase